MKRLGIICLILVGFALVAALYVTKTKAQSVQKEMERLQFALTQEQSNIRVLEAEIAHLQNPARLSELAKTHLRTGPTKAEQMITLDDLIVRVPVKAEGAQ